MDKNRLLEHKINRLLDMFPVVAIVGPRQCGKSTLVKTIRPDWKYYDLERPDDYQLITSDPLGFFGRQREKTIIDEAQQFPELFKILRGVIDQDRKAAGRFLLTGSSSPEIVKGLSESLAGRIATIELWPFKTVEFYERPFPPVYDLLSQYKPDLDQIVNLAPRTMADFIVVFQLYVAQADPGVGEGHYIVGKAGPDLGPVPEDNWPDEHSPRFDQHSFTDPEPLSLKDHSRHDHTGTGQDPAVITDFQAAFSHIPVCYIQPLGCPKITVMQHQGLCKWPTKFNPDRQGQINLVCHILLKPRQCFPYPVASEEPPVLKITQIEKRICG